MSDTHSLRRWSTLALLLVGSTTFAQSYRRDNYRDIRWLGRGNTGVAVINDGTALFYNPAGIGLQDAYAFSLLNPVIGADENFYTSAAELSSVTSGDKTLSEKFAPFLGKTLALPATFFPHVAVPNFAGGFWDTFDALMMYRNPVNPELQMNARNDYGVILGSGFAYQKYFAFGASLRYQKRKIIEQKVTGGTLLSARADTLNSLIRNGEGWGLNVGAQARAEINGASFVALGAAIEDLGNTRFKDASGNTPPSMQGMQMNFGAAYGLRTALFDLTLLADVRQWNRNDVHMSKKLFMGGEANLLKVDLRAGIFQGYWTAGLSLRVLPIFDIDFATYGEEMGYAAGIKEARIWMIGLRTGIGLKSKSGKVGKSGKRYRSQLDAL